MESRIEAATDVATAAPVAGLRALLEDLAPGWPAGVVPHLGHWLYFLPRAPHSMLDTDGHPRRGGDTLLPPIDLPRRMWAGGRLWFDGAIAIGAALERRSTVLSVAPKTGRSGPMVFVTVEHAITSGGRVVVREEQDLVYRGMGDPAPPVVAGPARTAGERDRRVAMDAVALFRYSALTFNAHRIHYDRDYAVGVEGYPGLVVHGPLIATLLLSHWQRRNPGAAIGGFEFRAERPVFDGDAFDLVANGATVTAIRADGSTAMVAQVTAR